MPHHPDEEPRLQPLLHDAAIVLRAPAQAWSRPDGRIGAAPIDGIYLSDVRVVSALAVAIAGRAGEHIATSLEAADRLRVTSLHRELDDDRVADPDLRSELERTALADGVLDELTIVSRLDRELRLDIEVRLRPALDPMDAVKQGAPSIPVEALPEPDGAVWSGDAVTARVQAPGAEVAIGQAGVLLRIPLAVPPRGRATASWRIRAEDADAVVRPAVGPAPWAAPDAPDDDRLGRWLERALGDLDALRLRTAHGEDEFLAAGAPWFLTLFGRDSLWAARLLLPTGTALAASTLRVLAGLQGRDRVAATAEQPGKIMHELRRGTLEIPGEGVSLPPLYYGTVDATPLWICLLHDAWRHGMPEAEVRELLPALEAALAWMRDFGDSDGDGLLEYVDETGTGLSNQGWKDSGDSVQWRDGRLADGPIALCEVQAYAYEAAVGGAELLDALRGAGAGETWRAWAGRLRRRFGERFWVEDETGRYPAIALDAAKQPVDSLTSNLGHLLGTGLLDPAESALVAARLASPQLASGFGLRTMSTLERGYWPLSYHGGSVWTHDTAIAVHGLAREGFHEEAALLAEGLLRAAAAFGYRMPELHSGDAAGERAAPAPYPAACRPQAWSAAAAVAVHAALR
ncbi:glycogen debranching N-terminal domain-containing protein [Homoserinibacter sp. YIM 151385]|uniref:glycogen debranching N-terminal domain-containing protein n=1 Tax=Homoserinibacter sp. YIM 151385 TaxID=2985506 RepID=UPI0022F00793|nr:glycogen debranching N-terminal domain-containing protein [Homoserinibacter sp. YIM 151385]WBU37391.1 amylo-alpha-1,6-glucosidase [Homoserinibacter sp. YIM 151385]